MADAGHGPARRLGLGTRLALAFVGVSLSVVGAVAVLAVSSLSGQARQLVGRQEANLARAMALASGAASAHAGWAHAQLTPVIDLADHTGAAMRGRDPA